MDTSSQLCFWNRLLKEKPSLPERQGKHRRSACSGSRCWHPEISRDLTLLGREREGSVGDRSPFLMSFLASLSSQDWWAFSCLYAIEEWYPLIFRNHFQVAKFFSRMFLTRVQGDRGVGASTLEMMLKEFVWLALELAVRKWWGWDLGLNVPSPSLIAGPPLVCVLKEWTCEVSRQRPKCRPPGVPHHWCPSSAVFLPHTYPALLACSRPPSPLPVPPQMAVSSPKSVIFRDHEFADICMPLIS